MNVHQWKSSKSVNKMWKCSPVTRRKALLLFSGYLRQIQDQGSGDYEQVLWAIGATELFANGLMKRKVWERCCKIALFMLGGNDLFSVFFYHLTLVPTLTLRYILSYSHIEEEMKLQGLSCCHREKVFSGLADIIRCLFQNPFQVQSVVLPSWSSWNYGTIMALAKNIDENRAFEEMPILADAMDDAGCHDATILEHLRDPGPHVRGCWALDLLLGKN